MRRNISECSFSCNPARSCRDKLQENAPLRLPSLCCVFGQVRVRVVQIWHNYLPCQKL